MIVYFADRQLYILGQASTELPQGMKVIEDLQTEDVETGVAIFECKVPFDKKTRSKVEACTEVGNYVLLSDGSESKLFTIIDSEKDTKRQEVYIYAEDGGMDLLNDVFGAYEADKAYPITHYINKYAAGAGFQIGINEAASLTRKLIWDGEATAAERIASVATQFDGCEVSYSFDVEGLVVTKKYINIYKERGKDIGVPLRLNKEVDRIVTKKSIANLATALQCTGGTPENAEDPITLDGYKYDDGDFYVDGGILKSREALKRWNRYLWKNEQSEQIGGHIVKPFSYDTTSQSTLCAHAITEMKKIRDIEVNYEADIIKLPDNTKVGDRVDIVDDEGELYLSTRILKLEVSRADQTCKATFGEFLIKSSGISQTVADLAAQFALSSKSVARASAIANNALEAAVTAKQDAEQALQEIEDLANSLLGDAGAAVALASDSAEEAQTAAEEAKAMVEEVNAKVTSLQTTINNAQIAADNAQLAATIADEKADEAKTAAQEAAADAEVANQAAILAQNKADTAAAKADTAQGTAEIAKTDAATAKATAEAAKEDAQQAQRDIDSLAGDIETISTTMEADYARKTELTEATASLRTQISQNAAEISSTASRVQTIDETANNAKTQAEAAQTAAATAQEQADQAAADAQAAQTAADEAAAAATAAQNEADTAKTAAATAQSVADKAEADLEAAKADLATVASRVDATEEEIIAAQQAVEAAQMAADKAKTDAGEAVTKAVEAQSKANTAATNADNALTTANNAASQAALAQLVADEAKGNATAAQNTANQAASVAAEAQRVADTAKTNAEAAQATANQAVADAATAQAAANDADAKADQAAADLETAKQNLANVTSRVGATEEEIEAAKTAVITAQTAADRAQEEAEAAQATADTAKTNAANAQTAANNAKTAADNAQTAADEAQQAADEARAAVDALAVRVTTAETKITQNTEQISLMAKKTEVTQTLGGYYTKEQADAAIQLKADSINSSVKSTYATKQEVKDIEIGGRNLYIAKKAVDGYLASDGSGNLTAAGGVTKEKTSDFIAVDAGDEVKFQIWVTTPTDSYVWYGYQFFKSDKTVLDINRPASHEYDMAGGLYHAICRYSIIVPDDAAYLRVSARMFEDGKIKVEKGNKTTDWTPAPEDIESGIDTAQETADQASESATSANERITTAESLIQQLSNCIAMLVTDENGESLMTQTDDGWTFSMKETSEAVSSLTDLLETLEQETGSTKAAVEVLTQAISDHGETLEYVTVTTYENEPCIELGESDSNFKLMITNTRIMFMNGGNVPTYINTNGLVTQNIEVQGEIVQGGFVMLNTSDGGWGLLWKGVSS